MRVFGIKSCDTCRKALREIKASGQSVDWIDVRVDGVDASDLAKIVAEFEEKAINRASTTWRSLDETEKGGDITDLLRAHPTLMKRPVIEKSGVWTMGWKADVSAEVLGGTTTDT